MTVEVYRVAKYLGRRSRWKLSNLEMQKIIYLSHMIYLGRTGRPLVYGDFEAWDYGPVHPALYHFLKSFGANPVTNSFRMFDYFEELDTGEESRLINFAVQAFPHDSGVKLISITHSPPSAWCEVYEPGKRGIIIPEDLILEEYKKRFDEE